jgi:hypothetical protein
MGLHADYVRVPHSFLKECYNYTDDGKLVWAMRPTHHFKNPEAWQGWFTRCYGKPLGSVDKQGYYQVALHYNGKIQRLHVHRVIMCLHLGRDLKRSEVVDHINRDKQDNRVENLRLVNHSVNALNTAPRKNNTSGYKYISWCKQKTKWQVSSTKPGKRVHVGFYETLDEAILAKKTYEENL